MESADCAEGPNQGQNIVDIGDSIAGDVPVRGAKASHAGQDVVDIDHAVAIEVLRAVWFVTVRHLEGDDMARSTRTRSPVCHDDIAVDRGGIGIEPDIGHRGPLDGRGVGIARMGL